LRGLSGVFWKKNNEASSINNQHERWEWEKCSNSHGAGTEMVLFEGSVTFEEMSGISYI